MVEIICILKKYLFSSFCIDFTPVRSPARTWAVAVNDAGVGPELPKMSRRTRSLASTWKNIPLSQWRVNESLWVAATRREMVVDKLGMVRIQD